MFSKKQNLLIEKRINGEIEDDKINRKIERRFKKLKENGFEDPFLRECRTVICHGDYEIIKNNKIADDILFLIRLRDCF